MNKRGDFFQIFFMLIILLIAAIVGLICLKLATEIDNAYQETPRFNDSSSAQIVLNFSQNQAPTIIDELIFFLFLGTLIGLMIAAVRTNFSAAVIFLFIIQMLIAVLVASGIVNIYQGFAQAPTLSDVATKLTLTNVVFSRYTPLFICIIGALILIMMYSKSGSDIRI